MVNVKKRVDRALPNPKISFRKNFNDEIIFNKNPSSSSEKRKCMTSKWHT